MSVAVGEADLRRRPKADILVELPKSLNWNPMAYELHIKRKPQGISLEEWLQAVATVPGLRPTNAPAVASNPRTGETISVLSDKGTVEVLSDEGEWFIAFRFARNQISFKATPCIESASDPTHIAASALAEKLGAEILGDEGETYSW